MFLVDDGNLAGHATYFRVLDKTAEAVYGVRVHPVMHPVEKRFEAPFFFADEQVILDVHPEESFEYFNRFDGYYGGGGIVVRPERPDLPELVDKPVLPPKNPLIDPVGPIDPPFGVRIDDDTPFVFDGVPLDVRGRTDVRPGR
jgi:hypothetical protein